MVFCVCGGHLLHPCQVNSYLVVFGFSLFANAEHIQIFATTICSRFRYGLKLSVIQACLLSLSLALKLGPAIQLRVKVIAAGS